MRIGIDFDNTIVNYEGVFHQAAIERQLIPENIGHSKAEVKRYLIEKGQETVWTELQGVVYGSAIKNAKPYAGVVGVIDRWINLGLELHVISHKTQYPIIGEKLDFHVAATQWLEVHGLFQKFTSVNFCSEKQQKIAKIGQLQVDWFIDDLPSILTHQDFPIATQRLLFSAEPDSIHDFKRAENWHEIFNTISPVV